MDSLSREGFGTLMREASNEFDERALDEYWKAFTQRRRPPRHARALRPSTSTS